MASAVLLGTLLVTVTPPAMAHKPVESRRSRFRAMAHAFIRAALPSMGFFPEEEESLPNDGPKYELKLARATTGEEIDVIYRIGDTYIPSAISRLNTFLRDNHTQQVENFDPREFDLLHTVLAKLGRTSSSVQILSGYRSQESNDELRDSHVGNAAKFSQHILAKAMDIRIPGIPASLVRDAAMTLAAGGVGYYPQSQFVHVDVGPVRHWTFIAHASRHGAYARGRHHEG